MKMLKYLILILLVFMVTGAISFFYLESSVGSSQTVVFEIKEGDTLSQIAHRLKEKDLTRSQLFFYYYGRLVIYWNNTKIQKGSYQLNGDLSTNDILERFVTGKVIPSHVVITIPEGYNRYDMANLFAEKKLIKNSQDFIELTQNKELLEKFSIEGDSADGYLYPSTYYFKKDESLESIVNKMLNEFKKEFPEQEFAAVKDKLQLTRHQIITLASLIEKETGVPEERNLVSSVFHNRLKKEMKMECDPTVIYALLREGRYKGSLSRSRGDLDIDSPYNTYKYKKLPPSPISNPSRESMLAAINPQESEYIYFVAKDDKSHYFAKTWAEHLKNVDLYRKRVKEQRQKEYVTSMKEKNQPNIEEAKK